MIDAFLDYLKYERNRSERTVAAYGDDLRAFQAFFEGLNGQLTWASVDADVIRDWMESMMDKGNNATSVGRRLSALRSFYRFALSRQLVSHDPSRGIAGPKKSKPLPQFVKEEEMDALLDGDMWTGSYADVLARTIIMTFYETGMRLAELVGLDDVSVDFDAGQIKVWGKRDKQRLIPFGRELRETLQSYIRLRDETVIRRDTALFVDKKGKRIPRIQVQRMVARHLAKVSTLKKRSPHVLRHTFATSMLNHDAGLESLKRLLGHESLATTEIYTHTTFEQLKKVYQHAHPRA